MQDHPTRVIENPAKVRRDSIKMLRTAWPHRHESFRAPHVIRANVAMLRRLRDQEGGAS